MGKSFWTNMGAALIGGVMIGFPTFAAIGWLLDFGAVQDGGFERFIVLGCGVWGGALAGVVVSGGLDR